MPHIIRAGRVDLSEAWKGLATGPWRWGNAVARIEGCFLARGGRALLVSGVAVEYGRPLHVVVIVTHHEGTTAFHLWSVVAVERTDSVKRFLAQVSRESVAFGCGEVISTNIAELA